MEPILVGVFPVPIVKVPVSGTSPDLPSIRSGLTGFTDPDPGKVDPYLMAENKEFNRT